MHHCIMFRFQLMHCSLTICIIVSWVPVDTLLSNHMHHCIMFRFQLMHCSLTRPTVSSPTQLKHRQTTWTYLMQCSKRILGKNMHPLHQNPFRCLVHNMLWAGYFPIFILVIPPWSWCTQYKSSQFRCINFMDMTYRLCF